MASLDDSKTIEFDPTTDFVILRFFQDRDESQVINLVCQGLASYGVRSANNRIGSLKTPVGYTTKEGLRACFDNYITYILQQDLASISTSYSREKRSGMIVAELFTFDKESGATPISDEALATFRSSGVTPSGYSSQIVGSVGFQPCRLGDKRYYTALVKSYVDYQVEMAANCPQDDQALSETELESKRQRQAEEWAELECELRRMSISARCRGLGLGRMLVAALVQLARAEGFTRLHLSTGVRMPAAYEFYHSLGFVDIGHVWLGSTNPSNVLTTADGLGPANWDDYIDPVFDISEEWSFENEHPDFFFDEVHYGVRLAPWSGTKLNVSPAALDSCSQIAAGNVSVDVPYRVHELLRKPQVRVSDKQEVESSPFSPTPESSSSALGLGSAIDSTAKLASDMTSAESTPVLPTVSNIVSANEPPELVNYDLAVTPEYVKDVLRAECTPHTVGNEVIFTLPFKNFHPKSPILNIPQSHSAHPQVFFQPRLHRNHYQERYEWSSPPK